MTPRVWFSVVALFCLYTGSYTALLEQCPSAEDSSPCTCQKNEDVTEMSCSYLGQSKSLSDAFHNNNEYELSIVYVTLYMGPYIESDAFKGPAINEIVVSNSFFRMHSPQFVGQENSLKYLSFFHCFTSQVNVAGAFEDVAWTLGHLKKLKELTFANNDIPVLKNNWLTSTGPSLRTVTFNRCSIQELEDRVFEKLTSLMTLFLEDNKIKTISRSMFPRPALHLEQLILNGNQIETLPDDIFRDMPVLTSVQLERNQIKTFSESVWSFVGHKNLRSLRKVYLAGNPIYCDEESLKWKNKENIPKYVKGLCAEPEMFKNHKIIYLIDYYNQRGITQ